MLSPWQFVFFFNNWNLENLGCQLLTCYIGEDIDKARRSTVVFFPVFIIIVNMNNLI